MLDKDNQPVDPRVCLYFWDKLESARVLKSLVELGLLGDNVDWDKHIDWLCDCLMFFGRNG